MDINYWEILQKHRGTLNVFSCQWDFMKWLPVEADREQVVVVVDTCAILSHMHELDARAASRSPCADEQLSLYRALGRRPEDVIIFLPRRVKTELEKLARERNNVLAERAKSLGGARTIFQTNHDAAQEAAFSDELIDRLRGVLGFLPPVPGGDDHILRNTLLLRAFAASCGKSVVFYTNDRELQSKMACNGVTTYASPTIELR
jgi:rRNA-processing protein FCF1